MVLPGLGEETGAIPAPESMATSPKISRRLHNFTLPSLKWGSQRHLRCTKAAGGASADISSSGDRRSPASRSVDSTVNRKMELEQERNQAASARSSRMRKPRVDGGDSDVDDGFDAMRLKLMLDLKTAADKMKDKILRNKEDEEKEEEQESSPTVTEAVAEGVKPWKLRSRRAECKSPVAAVGGSGKGLKIDEKKPNCSSPVRTNGNSAVKLPNLRSNSEKTQQRPKFSLQLSKKEIEEDFMAMVGHRPPRRPSRRPKAVQKQMDTLFPGMWLTEVTPDTYKVPEAPENSKARKGKGKMHLSESDEEL